MARDKGTFQRAQSGLIKTAADVGAKFQGWHSVEEARWFRKLQRDKVGQDEQAQERLERAFRDRVAERRKARGEKRIESSYTEEVKLAQSFEDALVGAANQLLVAEVLTDRKKLAPDFQDDKNVDDDIIPVVSVVDFESFRSKHYADLITALRDLPVPIVYALASDKPPAFREEHRAKFDPIFIALGSNFQTWFETDFPAHVVADRIMTHVVSGFEGQRLDPRRIQREQPALVDMLKEIFQADTVPTAHKDALKKLVFIDPPQDVGEVHTVLNKKRPDQDSEVQYVTDFVEAYEKYLRDNPGVRIESRKEGNDWKEYFVKYDVPEVTAALLQGTSLPNPNDREDGEKTLDFIANGIRGRLEKSARKDKGPDDGKKKDKKGGRGSSSGSSWRERFSFSRSSSAASAVDYDMLLGRQAQAVIQEIARSVKKKDDADLLFPEGDNKFADIVAAEMQKVNTKRTYKDEGKRNAFKEGLRADPDFVRQVKDILNKPENGFEDRERSHSRKKKHREKKKDNGHEK